MNQHTGKPVNPNEPLAPESLFHFCGDTLIDRPYDIPIPKPTLEQLYQAIKARLCYELGFHLYEENDNPDFDFDPFANQVQNALPKSDDTETTQITRKRGSPRKHALPVETIEDEPLANTSTEAEAVKSTVFDSEFVDPEPVHPADAVATVEPVAGSEPMVLPEPMDSGTESNHVPESVGFETNQPQDNEPS